MENKYSPYATAGESGSSFDSYRGKRRVVSRKERGSPEEPEDKISEAFNRGEYTEAFNIVYYNSLWTLKWYTVLILATILLILVIFGWDRKWNL